MFDILLVVIGILGIVASLAAKFRKQPTDAETSDCVDRKRSEAIVVPFPSVHGKRRCPPRDCLDKDVNPMSKTRIR